MAHLRGSDDAGGIGADRGGNVPVNGCDALLTGYSPDVVSARCGFVVVIPHGVGLGNARPWITIGRCCPPARPPT